MAVSVLMVCLGNICRSPLAEAAFGFHAAKMGLDARVDSAGTGGWHAGEPPDLRARDVALRLGGIDIGHLRARQVRQADFCEFDHIVAMDHDNLRNLQALRPTNAIASLSLLGTNLEGTRGDAIADPYYGDITDFEACWRHIDHAARAFARRLVAEMY